MTYAVQLGLKWKKWLATPLVASVFSAVNLVVALGCYLTEETKQNGMY